MSKTQIILSSNPYYYDKSADNYILIDYSLVREDTINRYKNNFKVIDYFPDSKDYGDMKQYVANLSNKYVKCYCKEIEKKFNIQLSENQLNIYWGGWLQGFISDLYVRYEFIKQIDNRDAYVVYNDRMDVSRDWRQYGSISSYSSDYHSLIYEKLLSNLGFEIRSKSSYDWYSVKEKINEGVSKNLNRIKKYYKNPVNLKNKVVNNKKQSSIVISETDDVLVVQSRMPKSMEEDIKKRCTKRISFVEDIYFRSRMERIMQDISLDLSQRDYFFTKFSYNNEFEKLLDVMVASFIPQTLFEGIGELHKEAERLCTNWKHSKIYHSACMEELFLLCAGIMKEKGCFLADIQHSAVYGNIPFFGYSEYSLYDRFCTWGWEPCNLPFNNIRKVAMSRIPQKPIGGEIPKKNKILMACNFPELSIGGTSCSYLRYTSRQKEFIDNLSEDCRRQLVIRTDITQSQSDLKIWCKKKYPYIRFESRFEIPFIESVKESKILVCDYCGSPNVEALMLNCPFVMFNAAQLISPNIGLSEILNEMNILGIYCDDGTEMAKILSKKINVVDEWMNQDEVKQVLRKYKHEVTAADQDIIKLWCEEFDEK